MTNLVVIPRPTSAKPSPQPTALGTIRTERETRDQRTVSLVEELRHGSPRGREHVLEELITVNMPVARSIAARYRWRGIPTADLEQVAYLGLIKAAHRFDPDVGHTFLAFTVPTIRGEVRRYFRDRGWMVRPPRRLQELQLRALRTRADMSVEHGTAPSLGELATALEEPEDEVREAMSQKGCFTPASLDRPVGEGGAATVIDLLAEPSGEHRSSHDPVEALVVLAPAVRRLSERDRHILQLRFYDGLTQREIAERLRVTQVQVSRLLSRIFRDLRQDIGSLEPAR